MLRRSIRIFAPGIRHYALLDMEDLPMFRERFRDDPGVEFVVSRNLLPRSIEERRVRARSWQGALLRRIAWRTKMLPDPLNGWRLQQFMKLYFLRQAPTPNVVFMDSDIVLCAPVDEDYFFEDGALRLLELPAHNVEDHAFDVCTHLLMQTPVQEARAFYNYILQVPRFRRATGEVLMAALERQSAKSDWHDRFMQLPFPSEYNLLGYAARHLQGYAGYFREPVPARGWTYDIRFRGDEKNLDKVLQTCIDERGARRVLLVQSTLGMPESEYTAHIHAMLARLQAFHADAPAPEVA